jgi:hypothetical protein
MPIISALGAEAGGQVSSSQAWAKIIRPCLKTKQIQDSPPERKEVDIR